MSKIRDNLRALRNLARPVNLQQLRRRQPARTRVLVAGLCVVLLSAAAIAVLLIDRDGSGEVQRPSTSIAGTGGLQGKSFVVSRMRPTAVAVRHRDLWVAGVTTSKCPQEGTCSKIERIDGITGRVIRERTATRIPMDFAITDQGLWELSAVPDGSPYHLTLRDPTTLEEALDVVIPSSVRGGGSPGAHLGVHGDVAWVALQDDDGARVVAVDTTTGAISATTPLTNDQVAMAITVNEEGAWVVPSSGARLVRIDPKSYALSYSVEMGGERILDASASDDALWVVIANPAYQGTSTLQLNPTATQVKAKLAVAATSAVASGPAVWTLGDNPTDRAADADRRVVRLLNDSSGKVIGSGKIPPPSADVRIAADDATFVTADENGTVNYMWTR